MSHASLADLAPTTLRPARAGAAAWALLALSVTAAGAWFVVDTRASVFSILFLLLTLLTLGWFGGQVLAPERFSIRIEPDELIVRWPMELRWPFGVDVIAWEHVRAARVIRIAGEPTLELMLHGGASRAILLPHGADVARLHRFLAARLGIADSPDGLF